MKVYELLHSPERWTKDFLAKTEDRMEGREPHDSDAVCWCALGAILKCYPDTWIDVVRRVLDALIARGYQGIEEWNDSPLTKYEDVIALFKELDL